MYLFYYRVKWCSIYGIKYKIGVVVYMGYIELLLKFFVIKNIIVINLRDFDRCLFFIVKDIIILEYDIYIYFYMVLRVV